MIHEREGIRRTATLVALSAAVLGLLGTGCGDDSESSSTSAATRDTSASSTTGSSSTSSTESTSTESTTSVPAVPGSVVWPAADAQSSTDPKQVATEFATSYIGFAAPVIGDAALGSDGRATVEVRPRSNGPVTTVHLVQHGVGSQWFVVGASTPNIVPDPALTGSTITSPATLRGSSTAFEGTVDVAIRGRGAVESLSSGFVTGGTYGELGSFEGSVTFIRGPVTEGAVVFSTTNMEDGSLWEATVVPVVLG